MKYFLLLNAQNSISVLHLKELDLKMFKEKLKNFYRTFINQFYIIFVRFFLMEVKFTVRMRDIQIH